MRHFITRDDRPTVLLIDDDMVSREVMATVLTMSGYAIHTAAGGTEALALLAGEGCVPGVILMDVQMPGLSGIPLMEQLRARSQARLYVISASSTPQEVLDLADGFLQKPFPPESLTRLIEEQEARSHPPAELGLDPEETIINRETLAQLRDMMPEKGVRQIYEAIVADLNQRTTALQSALVKKEWSETRRLGHAIKGGASMAGAIQVARLGALVESGAFEASAVNQSDNGSVILADLRTAAHNLQRMLDGELKL